jgi:DNA-binding NarL/FixJ family response regulator
MRILLVDDHLLFQESLGNLIDAQPEFTVVGGATSVKSAVDEARRLKPDVVLMDFSLPDGTGLDATRAILEEQPTTQIIFLTVHEESEKVFEAIRQGAQGYLPKNIKAVQMLAYLRSIQRGEAAITPALTKRILEEFSKTPSMADPPTEVVSQLTSRQRQILRELRTGSSNRQIAAKLVISEQTVKNHVSRILNQLNFKNRHEAADFARRYNI